MIKNIVRGLYLGSCSTYSLVKLFHKDLVWYMKYFDTFRKFAKEYGRFGQTNCCRSLEIVAQSPINRPIGSHWISI